MTRHLFLADVLALTAAVMESDGWAAPVPRGGREGRLESADSRTQMAEQYEGADVIRQAVLLAVGIAEAQAFVDGNKRAALQAMLTFLYVNGVRVPLEDDGDALAGQILAIAGPARFFGGGNRSLRELAEDNTRLSFRGFAIV